jgi:hypothetical protein
MKMRSLVMLGVVAVFCAASTLLAAPGVSPGPVQELSVDELKREMQRLDGEVWRLSMGCAGADAVAPLQEQYSRLAAQLNERQRDERNPLDQAGDNCTSVTVIPSIPYTDTGTTVGYADDFVTPCFPRRQRIRCDLPLYSEFRYDGGRIALWIVIQHGVDDLA